MLRSTKQVLVGNRVSTHHYILRSIEVLASVRSRVSVTVDADPILAKALSPPWIGDLAPVRRRYRGKGGRLELKAYAASHSPVKLAFVLEG